MNAKLRDIFLKHGIFIENNEEKEPLNLSSLTFIAIVVDIEKEFDIYVPDKYLTSKELSTFEGFEKIVNKQVQKQSDSTCRCLSIKSQPQH